MNSISHTAHNTPFKVSLVCIDAQGQSKMFRSFVGQIYKFKGQS